jgi:hypothetical protein
MNNSGKFPWRGVVAAQLFILSQLIMAEQRGETITIHDAVGALKFPSARDCRATLFGLTNRGRVTLCANGNLIPGPRMPAIIRGSRGPAAPRENAR